MVASFVCLAPFLLFPGRRIVLAFTLATGVGTPGLQRRIDALERAAVRGDAFEESEKAFLRDLYRTLATGAALSGMLRQSGLLMDHYLDGTGDDFRLDPGIVRDNEKVRARMRAIRRTHDCDEPFKARSAVFHMPDRSQRDSVYGLYDGWLEVEGRPSEGKRCELRWRATIPWRWPSYAALRKKYGDPHAETFPIPNLKSVVLGQRHALFIDNGLGEHLVTLGLAQTFTAYAEWVEHE